MRLAVIPARGGSQRIPRKNIKPFCGKPMIAWSIEAARNSGCFDRIIVSTDDDEIAEVARQHGAQVPFVRPAELSDHHVGTLPVIAHAVEWFQAQGEAPAQVCCLYATAPFVRAEDLCRGLALLDEAGSDYAFTVTRYGFPIQRAIRINGAGRVEMFNPEHFGTRSQDLEEAYHDAGQFYWGSARAWLEQRVIFGPAAVPVVLPAYRVQDIDTPEDWTRAEWMFQALQAQGPSGAGMKIAFRADASLRIGSGHVMRCLTLADALKAQGADCHFISREHPGHLLELIRHRGYRVNCLAAKEPSLHSAIKNIVTQAPSAQQEPAHTAWLGSTWQADAQETAAILAGLQPDWLVVDHYALDWRWEEALAPHYRRLLVIDDLADRPHRCDLLLDQNLGRSPQHYAGLVPEHCTVLAGPRYALLRPEFAQLREYSLQRRRQEQVRRLLITMGGVDAGNATGRVLEALAACALPETMRITVVMGAAAPWLDSVRSLAARMAVPTEVVVDVNDMAQRMADSDLAIGAAGSTSWERCALGLPTLTMVVAANQERAGHELAQSGAVILLDWGALAPSLHRALDTIFADGDALRRVSVRAAALCDGEGTPRVVGALTIVEETLR